MVCPINTLFQHSRRYTALSAQPDVATHATLSYSVLYTRFLAYTLSMQPLCHSQPLATPFFLTSTLLLTPSLIHSFLSTHSPAPSQPDLFRLPDGVTHTPSYTPSLIHPLFPFYPFYTRSFVFSLICSGCLMV